MMIMRKAILIIFILIVVCIGSVYALFQISKSRTFQFFGEFVHRVGTDKRIVALTFDDGPTEYGLEVLDVLREKDVPATFYLVGENLEKNLDIGKRLVQDGHDLGNHSFTHQRFLLKSRSFIADEIEKTTALIRETGYAGNITFRAPYGKKLIGLPWYLSTHNIISVIWDVEPDTNGSSADFLTEYTIQNTRNGSIILIHPWCKECTGAREAVPRIIDALRESGYTFVTISELLKERK